MSLFLFLGCASGSRLLRRQSRPLERARAFLSAASMQQRDVWMAFTRHRGAPTTRCQLPQMKRTAFFFGWGGWSLEVKLF